MRTVKVIKSEEREDTVIQSESESTDNPDRWSTEVRSWVVEFKQNRRVESLPAFESLFKDTQPDSGAAN